MCWSRESVEIEVAVDINLGVMTSRCLLYRSWWERFAWEGD